MIPSSHVSHISPRLRRHLAYAVVISCLAVLATYTGVLPIFRSRLMAYLAIDDAGFGLLFSISAISGLASVLLGGTLIDRWGPVRIIRIGLLGVGGAMLILALCGARYWLFVMAMIVFGVFIAPLSIAITAYLARLFPRHQRRVISLNLASSSLGGMLFPLVGEGLLALSKQSPYFTFARVLHLPFILVGSLLLAASLLYRTRMPSHAPRLDVPSTLPPWHWRQFQLPAPALTLTVLMAVHGMADASIYIWMARYLESGVLSGKPIAPGVVLSGYALAYLLSRGILAALPDRVGRRVFLVLPGLLGGGLTLAGLLSHQYLFTAGGYLLGSFCWSFEYPTMISTVLQLHQKQFGAVMAVAGVLTGLLQFTAMNGMGLWIARLDNARMWQPMCIPAVAFLLVSLGGALWWRRFGRQQKAV